jgi:hypothetical protein
VTAPGVHWLVYITVIAQLKCHSLWANHKDVHEAGPPATDAIALSAETVSAQRQPTSTDVLRFLLMRQHSQVSP